ncbi:hypothetical protein SAMN06264346_102543 [Chryseobacterium profundimaris]|uniref:Uncharacterized protein n=1 Tax=Chryseobacterium profundimaris TaxID=1387275 RepID=A0ABY1NPT0_9FLAO|nr:hypothetical protein SAMN06264346_102543 [Chryseobacterium profundimaris]
MCIKKVTSTEKQPTSENLTQLPGQLFLKKVSHPTEFLLFKE